MKQYIILQPDEDGNIVKWYSEEELEEVLNNPEDYGISEFIVEAEDLNPNNWEEGKAMLLGVKVKEVEIKAVAFKVKEK